MTNLFTLLMALCLSSTAAVAAEKIPASWPTNLTDMQEPLLSRVKQSHAFDSSKTLGLSEYKFSGVNDNVASYVAYGPNEDCKEGNSYYAHIHYFNNDNTVSSVYFGMSYNCKVEAPATWPQAFNEIPSAQLHYIKKYLSIHGDQLRYALDLSKYTLESAYDKGDGLSVAMYSAHQESDHCDEGNEYTIYVNSYNGILTSAGAFANYGCHED